MTVQTPEIKVKLNLVGLNGNAFALIGSFSQAAKRQGFDEQYITEVVNECYSGDYNNVLNTLTEHTQ